MSGKDKLSNMKGTIGTVLEQLVTIDTNLKNLKDVYIALKNNVRVQTGDIDQIRAELSKKLTEAEQAKASSEELIKEYEGEISNLEAEFNKVVSVVDTLAKFNPEIDQEIMAQASNYKALQELPKTGGRLRRTLKQTRKLASPKRQRSPRRNRW
jgi:chromosome segregation ATPase